MINAGDKPVVTLPDELPGHWSSAEGREIAQNYLARERVDLCSGHTKAQEG